MLAAVAVSVGVASRLVALAAALGVPVGSAGVCVAIGVGSEIVGAGVTVTGTPVAAGGEVGLAVGVAWYTPALRAIR